MAVSPTAPTADGVRTDWAGVARELTPRFAGRAAAHDADDTFVAENYAELRERRLFSAGVPAELGGGGASHAEMCDVLRTLAHGCSSTALALSMHTHQVLIPAWRWRHERAPVEVFLRRVAAEELILVTSGGSDWLAGSGRAEKVEGGYRVTGRKVFASGSPAGNLFMTMAIHDDPREGATVVHVAIPFDAPGLTVHDNWRTLGMRGTGSHPCGTWSPRSRCRSSTPCTSAWPKPPARSRSARRAVETTPRRRSSSARWTSSSPRPDWRCAR